MTVQETTESLLVTEFDQTTLNKIEAVIKNGNNGHRLKLVGADGEEVELPASISKALQSLVGYLAKGQAVNVSPVDKEVSLDEAADILLVSNYYISELLDNGEISFTGKGEARRIQLRELLEYNQRHTLTREERLTELTRMSQEMGLYDLPPEAYK
jgi:excisionase family DNA binding protein